MSTLELLSCHKFGLSVKKMEALISEAVLKFGEMHSLGLSQFPLVN